VKNGSHVYCILLDASKAFDRVEYAKLFNLLLDRGINSVIVRCMLYMYSNQKLCVNWQGHKSRTFNVLNGVKQGGVLSPFLFGIYVDELICRLKNTKVGCYVGPHFAGVMAYADDIVLLSPNRKGLYKLIEICKEYALEYKVLFNGTKSQYIVFHHGRKLNESEITFCGARLKNQASVIHLGHKIYDNLNNDDNEGVIGNFYKQFNVFFSRFKKIPAHIQAKLLKQYCSSFYGFQLLKHNNFRKLQTVWRKALRKVWNLPARTHCSLLRCLSNGVCDKHMFIGRFLSYAENMATHSVNIVRYVTKMATNNDISKLGNNWMHCRADVNVVNENCTNIKAVTLRYCDLECKSIRDKCHASVVKELIAMKEGTMSAEINLCEINGLIEEICTN
jgi:hypothetical protein